MSLASVPRPLLTRLAVLIALLLAGAVALGAGLPLPSATHLTLRDLDAGRTLLDVVLRDGDPVTFTWHNSLFDQPVREIMYARGGQLVLDSVAFLDPTGSYEMPVAAADVADLYHTGGAFSATGLNRPYSRVVYRIGEIGDMHVQVGERTVALLAEAGFGARRGDERDASDGVGVGFCEVVRSSRTSGAG